MHGYARRHRKVGSRHQGKRAFSQPRPASSPSSDSAAVICPGCARTIRLQPHELSLNVECAQCGTNFVPAQAAAQAPASPSSLEDLELFGLVKDATLAGTDPHGEAPHSVGANASIPHSPSAELKENELAGQGACPECGSKVFIPREVAAHAPGSFGGLYASVQFKTCGVEAEICASCGFIKFFAEDPQALVAAFRRARRAKGL